MRVLSVEDEPYMAEAIRDGLRLEAIAADIAGDGDTALGLPGINAYDIAVLDRDVPGPSVVSAEELLERAWDENADPFTNAVRITVSALRERLGEPWIIATVPGAGYRIDAQAETGHEGGDRG
ncbi:DNA-binding response regulator [Spirillospora sp. NPDC046719]